MATEAEVVAEAEKMIESQQVPGVPWAYQNRTIEEVFAALSAPFPSRDIKWRLASTSQEKQRGLAVPFVDVRACRRRLNGIFGIARWQGRHRANAEHGFIYDFAFWWDGEWIWKSDAAGFTDIEPVKGGASDSMKRTVRHVGIGEYLYGEGDEAPSEWVDIVKAGSSWAIKGGNPRLPDRFLPEDERGRSRPKASTATPARGIDQAQGRLEPREDSRKWNAQRLHIETDDLGWGKLKEGLVWGGSLGGRYPDEISASERESIHKAGGFCDRALAVLGPEAFRTWLGDQGAEGMLDLTDEQKGELSRAVSELEAQEGG